MAWLMGFAGQGVGGGGGGVIRLATQNLSTPLDTPVHH